MAGEEKNVFKNGQVDKKETRNQRDYYYPRLALSREQLYFIGSYMEDHYEDFFEELEISKRSTSNIPQRLAEIADLKKKCDKEIKILREVSKQHKYKNKNTLTEEEKQIKALLHKVIVYLNEASQIEYKKLVSIHREQDRINRKEAVDEEIPEIESIFHTDRGEELRKCLRQRKNYTFTQLKEKLWLGTDEELFFVLLNFLKEEENKINIDRPVKEIKYVDKSFKYLTYNADKLDIKNKDFQVKLIEEINAIIKSKLQNVKISKSNKDHIDNINHLHKIQQMLSLVKINICYEKQEKKKKLKEYMCEDTDLCNLFSYLVFDIRNMKYIMAILKLIPEASSLRDKQGIFLIEKIIDEYLNIVGDTSKTDDSLYYNKLILYFLENTYNGLETYEYQNYFNKVNAKRKNIQKKNLDGSLNFILDELSSVCRSLGIDKHNQKEPTVQDIYNQYHIHTNFSDDIIKMVNEISFEPVNRIDMRDRKVITIDEEGTHLYENAISFTNLQNGNFRVSVYIIDADEFIPKNGLLDKEASQRGYSIEAIKMIPRELTRGYLSLQENIERPVVAYDFEITPQLEVVSFHADKAIICVHHNLGYNQIDQILKKNEKDELTSLIKKLVVLSEGLNTQRTKDNNYHGIKDIKQKILYGETEKGIKPFNAVGKKTNAEYTIFLNKIIADNCYNRGIPIIYRNNTFNNNQTIIELLKTQYGNNSSLDYVIKCIQSIYMPSQYDVISKGHEGLNIKHYTELSRPARSYASLINERLIKEYMIDGTPIDQKETGEIIKGNKEICRHLNSQKEIYGDLAVELANQKKYKC